MAMIPQQETQKALIADIRERIQADAGVLELHAMPRREHEDRRLLERALEALSCSSGSEEKPRMFPVQNGPDQHPAGDIGIAG